MTTAEWIVAGALYGLGCVVEWRAKFRKEIKLYSRRIDWDAVCEEAVLASFLCWFWPLIVVRNQIAKHDPNLTDPDGLAFELEYSRSQVASL